MLSSSPEPAYLPYLGKLEGRFSSSSFFDGEACYALRPITSFSLLALLAAFLLAY